MKKVVLFILFGIHFNITFGQEIDYPTEFAVWRYSYKEEAGQPSYQLYYYMEGDSTYMNNSYKKIINQGLINKVRR